MWWSSYRRLSSTSRPRSGGRHFRVRHRPAAAGLPAPHQAATATTSSCHTETSDEPLGEQHAPRPLIFALLGLVLLPVLAGHRAEQPCLHWNASGHGYLLKLRHCSPYLCSSCLSCAPTSRRTGAAIISCGQSDVSLPPLLTHSGLAFASPCALCSPSCCDRLHPVPLSAGTQANPVPFQVPTLPSNCLMFC
jgi:hypothetical protein